MIEVRMIDMEFVKKSLLKIKKIPKWGLALIMVIFTLAVTISISSFARYKNRINLENILSSVDTWDGTIADSYAKGTGTSSDPYIISNAREFAFFAEELKSTDYTGVYFKLSNNIVINNGLFNYDEKNLTYKLSNSVFYLKEYTDDLYQSSDYSDTKLSSINSLDMINSFNGYLDGDYHTIYGLYVYDDSGDVALFDNLGGNISNLYIENAVIYGGVNTAVLAVDVDGASVKNVYTSGYVVSKKVGTDSLVIDLDDYSVVKSTDGLSDVISVSLPSDLSSYVITEVHLKGNYLSSVEDQVIIVNGEELVNGEFDINLGAEVLDSISIVGSDEIEREITLSDLTYEIVYEYSVASGVISKASNSDISGLINKANVYSNYESAGLIGTLSCDLSNSYNNGSIYGNSVSGLISKVINSTSDVVISNVYNSGVLEGEDSYSLVKDIINNNVVTIKNSFNVSSSDYSIALVDDELVLSNVLDVTTTGIMKGTSSDIILEASEGALTVKEYMVGTLGYNEFVDSDDLEKNEENIWVYETDSIPTLYFDDINNAIAILYVGTYTWDDLGFELKDIYFSNNITFSIEEVDSLNPVSEAYYYISDEVLMRDEIESINEWTSYEDVVSITSEGRYVVYVKVVDQYDNVTYINSEQLVLDLNGPSVVLKIADKSWNNFKSELDVFNIVEDSVLTLDVSDNYSEVGSVEYYISNEFVSLEDLKSLSSENWTLYEETIPLSEQGIYVINIKAVDGVGHTTYINSDNIVYMGYEEEVIVGRNGDSSNLNVTDKSTISYHFTYESAINYIDGYTNNLITNMLLPVGTSLTLINNTTNDVYYYNITSSDDDYGYNDSCSDELCDKLATYPLTLFEKIGQVSGNMKFSDEEFLSDDIKDLTLVVDFSKASIESDFSLIAYLKLNDGNGEGRLSTLKDTLEVVNVYNDLEYDLNISKVNDVDTIIYNSNSNINIEMRVSVNNPSYDGVVINDTSIEDEKLGIIVKLVDSSNNVVSKEFLKNLSFKVGDTSYFANGDGVVRINLDDKEDVTLNITTYESNLGLTEGDYRLVIVPFIASDGLYTDILSDSYIEYDVRVNEVSSNEHKFNVISSDDDKIISKDSEEIRMDFDIYSSSSFKDASVRVSLYKKSVLSAYDQTYQLIDLGEFVSNELVSAEDKVYLVNDNEFSLLFDNSVLEKTGYELRFELYNGDKKVSTIKKKFIVR